jgi:hypothetical protein
MTRCLILSCTQAKRGDERPLPALERYDGPAFRVVRRFLREADPALRDVDVYALSARYGLISANQCIADYDQRMTPARAAELCPEVLAWLQEILSQRYAEVFLSLGRSYLQAVNGFEALVPDGTRVTVSRDAAGRRLTELKRWLYRLPEGTFASEHPERHVRVTGQATLRGRQIEAVPEEVLALARQALAEGHGDAQNFRDWYALVDGAKVSTKWLVSLLSGLDVSEFQASEARRVLGQLGVAVYHDE